MPSASRLARVVLDRRVPARMRVSLLATEARRRIRPADGYALSHGGGAVFLSHGDYAIDWETLKFVFADEAYAADYADAHVLDLGAHKGYFGAYALGRGARSVTSFEPERENVELLERAAASHRAAGADWNVRPAAVGAEAGEAELHVMGASWGHALEPPESWAEYEIGVQRVPVAALADILGEARERAGGTRVIAKLNIEGAECPTVLGTPASAWAGVAELHVETHPWAACGAPELEAHLVEAGFSRCESAHPLVLRLQRR